MSSTTPFGTFPTPYGVSVPVHKPDPIDPSDPDCVLFGAEATAICAGIHDRAERARFAAAAKRLGAMPAFADYGGHALPKVSLPRPQEPAYPRVAGIEADLPVEAWTTGVMDRHRWCDRASFMLDVVDTNMATVAGGADLAAELYPIGIAITLTAALEHLCETQIDCVEAAAFYAVTDHEEWREAGIAWLRPFRGTWFRDWRDARPRYASLARALTGAFELPTWLGATGGAA